jgi:vitamin B12 transporter
MPVPFRASGASAWLVSCCLFVASAPGNARAATPATTSGPAAPKVPAARDAEVVVTAARLEQPLDESLASVTVIRRADIERTQARSVEELLAGVEGLSIAGGGGLGKVTSVFVRGAESDHTLWLVDGVRIGSVTTGTPALQDLPIDTIERIEIVRGPRSSLYGADAIGGVVQVFTRRGRGAAPSLRLTGGSNGTRQGAASIGFGGESAWVDLQASHLETDGINACRGLPFPPGGGCFISEPDRDPYRNTSGNVRAGWRISPALEVQGFVQRTEGRGDFDGSFVNESELANQVAGLEFAGRIGDAWASKLAAGRSWDEVTSFRNGVQRSVFDTRRDTATWQNDLSLGERGQLVLGLDWLQDRVASSTRFVSDSRWNRAAFAQYQADLGRHEFSLAARLDENQQFGSNATGSLAWGVGLAGGLHVYASAGTAFKAPSFNELYFPGFGNPSLDPEKAQTLEIGVKQSARWGRWTLAAFGSDVDDLIAFDSATFLPQNIARARLAGVEGSLRLQRAGWRLEQSLTWLDTEDRSAGATRGRELPRRPGVSGRTTVGWADDRLDLAVSTQFAGRRYDDLANRQALGGYAVVDLTGGWRLSASTELQLRIANLFDRQYETAYLYPSLGREALVTVRYRAP